MPQLQKKEKSMKCMIVFSKACELGREQELFGLTKEQKEFYDTTETYHRAMDESEILGVHFYILFPII